MKRENLTQRIRTIENNLKSADNNRARLVADLEKTARQSYINSVYAKLYDFYFWEAFFKGEETSIRDFFILKNVRENILRIIDEIPQGQALKYKTNFDAFFTGWGI
jgi:hypothetical protein